MVKTLGTELDRKFRNDGNDNFTEHESEIASLDSRVSNLVANAGNSNAEIVDARQPATGSPFATLKARLDTNDNQIGIVSGDTKTRGLNIMYPSAPLVGAKGDGTDETTIINSMFANAPVGSTIVIPAGYKFTVSQVTLNVAEVTLTGGGTIKGSLFVGSKTGGQNKLNIKIDNVVFEQTTLTNGTKGIELGKSRLVTITRCLFKNIDKCVYVAPDQNYGFHDVSQIKMFHNQFQDVNYNVYVDLYDDFATNTERWMTCSDWQYIDNISNITVITPIWIEAIDGINVSNNTFFTSTSTGLRDIKEKGVYIGTSDWVNIVNNHVFTTGWEGIHLDNPRHYIISDNEFAWCGSREPRSTILTTGNSTENGVISDNNISMFTLHGVSLENTGTGAVSVKDNLLEYSSTSGAYTGTTSLSSVTHYTVNQVYSTGVTAMANGNELNSATHITSNIKKRYGSSFRTTKRSHLAGTFVSQTFSAAQTAYNLVELGAISGSKSNYDGMILINARQGDLDSTNTAHYILHVVKSGDGTYVCDPIKQGGMTTGAGASHPSFTFTLDGVNNLLKATGVGATVGTFYFHITYLGNIETIK